MSTQQSASHSHSRSHLALIISASLISVLLFAALVTVLLVKNTNHAKKSASSNTHTSAVEDVGLDTAPPAVSEIASDNAPPDVGALARGESAGAPPPRPNAKAAAAASSAPPLDENAGRLEITGRDFTSTSYDPPHLESGGMQLLQHYGETSAPLLLKKQYSQVVVTLKPRPAEDSYPVAKIFLDGVTRMGKNVRVNILDMETVQNDHPITKNVVIEPGRYKATLQFLRSSKDGRAHMEIRSILFL